ncbi:response regulator transcription factor [Nocardioides agariphilus]|uniref:Response regulator transcription factor n=1 Tax=Nocardioides agariphilus TaxID=433664 RepID=A0A930VLX1_9ACTN|nr:helix-turn-helix transcriptional regulator [Nocardioides agariphilus]MBF4767046.1 response regulator transcription factor [Nocardioides agariphilus]
MGVINDLARAREAYQRREWITAYDTLSDTDHADLDGDDFFRLAVAAHLVGRDNDSIQALQRAYQIHLGRGETLAAVRSADLLAHVLLVKGETAVGSGWVARCQRLLEDVEGDVVERGYVLIHLMMRYIFSGRFDEAGGLATRIVDYGRRYGDPDLVANGLNAQGRMLLYAGRVPDGLALLDEAMVGIATGEVSPIFAGEIYCSLIEACQEVSDFRRAAQWTSALTSWIDTQPGLVQFTGQCAVHRGQLMRVGGAFVEAVEEFRNAAVRYAAAETPAPAGLAMAECGEVLRILGDLQASEMAYDDAVGFGYEAQPGRSLLWLDRGRAIAAQAAVNRLLAEQMDPVHRSQLLPGAVEVMLAVGETETAQLLANELTGVAESFGCDALRAMAAYATGHVELASGRADSAVPELRRALGWWRSLDAPYEAARARLQLGRALRELGDEETATGEIAAARATFARLGALPAEREAARLLGADRPGGLTDRELEVLRLVARGSSNPEIAATLVLSEKTVARHLSNIFTKLDVGSRTAAAAFAFDNGLT